VARVNAIGAWAVFKEATVDENEGTAALVGRARAGDAAAFERLVRRHFRAAFAVALAILGSAADAEDVAQDAFIAAFEQLDRCRDPERFPGWLAQIVRNRALNAAQSKRTAGAAAARLDPPEPSLAPTGEAVGLRGRLLRALARITPAQREVVLLHDLDEWTHAEIGESLGISAVMSRQHLFQARRAMRAFLAEGTPEKEAAE
jgi:RNA polymerase sigma-70 factor (ECF subfamily)